MRIGTFCGKRAFWSNNKSSLARPPASCCGLHQPYKSTHLSTPPSAICQPYINHNINPHFWWGRRAIFQVTELQPSNRSSPPSSPGLKTGKQGHFSDDRWFKNGNKSDTTVKFVKLPCEIRQVAMKKWPSLQALAAFFWSRRCQGIEKCHLLNSTKIVPT